MYNMQTQDRVTRVKAKWLDGVSAVVHSHITTRFMPIVMGNMTGVKAIRAGLLQPAKLPDGSISFRPLNGAN